MQQRRSRVKKIRLVPSDQTLTSLSSVKHARAVKVKSRPCLN